MKKRVTVRLTRGTALEKVGREGAFGGSKHSGAGVAHSAYVFEGDIEVEVEDLERLVQVRYVGQDGLKTYTYTDPFGDLEVGELVDVPTRYEEHNAAIVVALGRGRYTGDGPRVVNGRYSLEVAA